MSLYENTIKIYTQYDYELCDISNEANIKLLKLRLDFKEKINPEPVVIKFYVKSDLTGARQNVNQARHSAHLCSAYTELMVLTA